jgi:hypothetical protein
MVANFKFVHFFDDLQLLLSKNILAFVLPGMSLFICDDALTSMDYCIALDNLLDY